MRLVFLILSSILVLSGCVTTSFPEQNITANRCADGPNSFDIFVDVPAEYGLIQALTQYENTGAGLVPICLLAETNGTFAGYSGEVSNGRSGMCLSARTSAAGHVLSCVSSAEVRRAIDAPAGSRANTLDFFEWRPYPTAS
jgi:hypothetical protein